MIFCLLLRKDFYKLNQLTNHKILLKIIFANSFYLMNKLFTPINYSQIKMLQTKSFSFIVTIIINFKQLVKR